jgi:putative hydrolase of the HAD superfamily
MRKVLGYDALFDVSCYSCDLGVAKPAPAFFAEAARRIGADPSAILFVDDSAPNVDGARAHYRVNSPLSTCGLFTRCAEFTR